MGELGAPPTLVDQLLNRAAAQRAELQAQIEKQKEITSQQSELLSRSLSDAAKEREGLREQLDKVYTDLHIITGQLSREQIGTRDRIQRTDVKGRGGQSRLAYRPNLEESERQPTHVCEMPHQTLAELAMLGNHSAHRERLLREIMAVEGESWGKAHQRLDKFDEYNERYYWLESLPYRLGLVVALTGGIAASFMVYWKPAALYWGETVANEELPEGVEDIAEMTTNQVGTWTWGWMEPMLGTASFALLCCQFSRTQVKKLNMKTYGRHVLQWRANRLADHFAEYDRSMVRAWAKHMPSVVWGMFPQYEKNEGMKGPSSGL